MSVKSPDAQFVKKIGGTLTGPTIIGGTENVTVVASATTITIDMDAGPIHFTDDLAHNTTLALSNAAAGKSATWQMVEDGTGSRTVAVPGSWVLVGAFTINSAADAANTYEIWQVGSVVYYSAGEEQ